MKVCTIQPRYSYDPSELDACFAELLAQLDGCTEDLDLIVLPEYSDVPAAVSGKEAFYDAHRKNNAILLERSRKTAIRTHAIVFVNCGFMTENGIRNTTYAINREGEIVGKYFKAHPAPSEVRRAEEGGCECDVTYSYEPSAPYVLELEGLRFGFMTCYDFYFYEAFARLAREQVDVVIGCSYQRTDTHEALSILNRFLCYQTNAYLVRASISLGEHSPVGGSSCVIRPDGTVLYDMQNDVGRRTVEIDPKEKYYKPAGFGGKPKSHYEYIEEGRRPWLYRNGGASVVSFDRTMPYPRLCAHGGLCAVAPENTLPAVGAAIALGAQEIALDLWATKDGVLVCASEDLECVSDGTGSVSEHTYEELLALDFGAHASDGLRGLKIARFEEVLQKFGARAVINVHVKIWDQEQGDYLETIVALLRQYDCSLHTYFTSKNDTMLARAMAYAPEIGVAVGYDGNPDPLAIVRRTLAIGAKRMELTRPHFNRETLALAKAHGIRTNVFRADDPEKAREYFTMGIDCILTNDLLKIQNATKDFF